MSEFIHMGGYASFVWSSYALTFVMMALILLNSSLSHKKILRKLEGKFRREQYEREQKEQDVE